ncbi:MAG: ActS/PrrB/RegB family redox-sensitive histidine kinase [Maricaulaceae bacterium]
MAHGLLGRCGAVDVKDGAVFANAEEREDEPEVDLLAPAFGRLRLRSLIVSRWLAVAGQVTTILVVRFGLGFELPLDYCLAAVAASAWLNIFLSVAFPTQRLVSDWEATSHLAYDILQLTVLLMLTGGLENPFILLFISPVSIAFTALRPKYAIALAALVGMCTLAMTRWSLDLPWIPGVSLSLPPTYVAGLYLALIIGIAFTGLYAWRVSREAFRMASALAASQAVLAREQKLSALGGLAAAAAHELGTPLATIQLTAKEMAHALDHDVLLQEDAQLLVSQARRCRDILRTLSRRGMEDDLVHAQQTLQSLLEDAAEAAREIGPKVDVSLSPRSGASAKAPVLRRRPEVAYAVGNFVENACDYARSRVRIAATWSDRDIEILIEDDGPGFSPDVLGKLGEPYITTRPGAADGAHGGLGLGFFIAKTLIERTGGAVAFGNAGAPRTGATVRLYWPRRALETPQKTADSAELSEKPMYDQVDTG